MIKRIFCASIICAVLVLAGCRQDKDNTKLSPYLYDYVPIDSGHSVIYDVDSITYSFTNGGTQLVNDNYYQLMYKLQDTFYGGSPPVNHIINIYKRTDTTQPFPSTPYQAWYCFETTSYFADVENDLAFEKLVFPPITGQTWQGNHYLPANDTLQDIYYPYADWIYTYTAVNVPSIINNMHFDSTLTVLQDSNQNLVTDEISTETYARHVGMIYKRFELIDKQSISSTWANPDSANGFRLIMQIHSYTP